MGHDEEQLDQRSPTRNNGQLTRSLPLSGSVPMSSLLSASVCNLRTWAKVDRTGFCASSAASSSLTVQAVHDARFQGRVGECEMLVTPSRVGRQKDGETAMAEKSSRRSDHFDWGVRHVATARHVANAPASSVRTRTRQNGSSPTNANRADALRRLLSPHRRLSSPSPRRPQYPYHPHPTPTSQTPSPPVLPLGPTGPDSAA